MLSVTNLFVREILVFQLCNLLIPLLPWWNIRHPKSQPSNSKSVPTISHVYNIMTTSHRLLVPYSHPQASPCKLIDVCRNPLAPLYVPALARSHSHRSLAVTSDLLLDMVGDSAAPSRSVVVVWKPIPHLPCCVPQVVLGRDHRVRVLVQERPTVWPPHNFLQRPWFLCLVSPYVLFSSGV